MNLLTKQKQSHRLKNTLMVTRRKGGGDKLADGDWCTHYYI